MINCIAPEARVPERHPLQLLRTMEGHALATFDAEFKALYSYTGRPSIPPGYLVRAMLLRILYIGGSKRLAVEQIH